MANSPVTPRRKRRPHTRRPAYLLKAVQDYQAIVTAVDTLHALRRLLHDVHCPRAKVRLHKLITSMEGAQRNADRTRNQLQARVLTNG